MSIAHCPSHRHWLQCLCGCQVLSQCNRIFDFNFMRLFSPHKLPKPWKNNATKHANTFCFYITLDLLFGLPLKNKPDLSQLFSAHHCNAFRMFRMTSEKSNRPKTRLIRINSFAIHLTFWWQIINQCINTYDKFCHKDWNLKGDFRLKKRQPHRIRFAQIGMEVEMIR